PIVQNVVNKIPHFGDVGCLETGKEVIREKLCASILREKSYRRLLQASHEYGSLGPYDFSADVVAVNGLYERFDISNRTTLVFQVHDACHNVTVLCDLRPDRDGCVGVRFDHFIAHKPASQVEVMNAVVVEQHAVQLGLIRGDGGSVSIPPDGLKDDGFADLTGFDALHGGCISGIVAAHKSDLQTHAGSRDSVQGCTGVGQVQGERLLRKNVLASRGGRADGLRVELVGSRDDHAINTALTEHVFQRTKGVFDLKVSSHLTGALYGRIGDSDEAAFGNKAANVFRVPSAHVANAKNANPQFSHANSLANLSALMNCLTGVA